MTSHATEQSSRPTIVVGVDGSEDSYEALRWAAGEARTHSVPLHVVLAWQVRSMSIIGADVPHDLNGRAERLAEHRLVSALAALGADLEGIELTSAAVEGPTRRVLREESESAILLVLGSRGHGKVSSLILGSVSRHMTVQSTCPVVVVRSDRARYAPTC
jgi:nucleotide-binding universal stress UspA family protein